MDYAHEWYNDTLRKDPQGQVIEGMPEIGRERIFFFLGEEGMGGVP